MANLLQQAGSVLKKIEFCPLGITINQQSSVNDEAWRVPLRPVLTAPFTLVNAAETEIIRDK